MQFSFDLEICAIFHNTFDISALLAEKRSVAYLEGNMLAGQSFVCDKWIFIPLKAFFIC